MKKILLTLALASLGMSYEGRAQVIVTQDFESATIGALPATWTQSSTGTGWETQTGAGSTWAALTGYYNLPAHSKYVVVDDAAKPTQLHDTLKSPVFSLTGKTDPFLNFDCFYYGATKTKSGISEHAYILGSSNGGTTWSVIDSVAPYGWNGSWITQHVDLAAAGISGANCRVAFTYTDGADTILGVALDNIVVRNLDSNMAGIAAIGYNNITDGISANGETLLMQIRNDGKTITSVDAYYTLNSGAQVTQSFTGLSVAPYTTKILQFTTPFAGAIAGTNNLRVGLTQANSTANIDYDSVKTSSFVMASASTQRQGLVEEFSSSTCAPCKAFNASYDPLCITLNANTVGSNFNIIKFQMNWPSPGTDRSYNNDGNTRKTYYACNSIPAHWVNGSESQVSWSSPFSTTNTTDFTAEAANASAYKSFMDITATYKVDTVRKKVGVTLSVTPHFTKSGTYHILTALCDKHYQNTTNTTGQLEYYHVMRKMVPAAAGHSVSSWADGVAQSFVDTGISYVNDNWYVGSSSYPTQMSSDFWSNPLLGSEMIVYVQDDATKSVMQSLLVMPVNGNTTAISTVSEVTRTNIYPNPTKGEANLHFSLGKASDVHVKVMDYAGRLVSDVINTPMAEGEQTVVINTAGIAAGNYVVMIEANGAAAAERLTVEK